MITKQTSPVFWEAESDYRHSGKAAQQLKQITSSLPYLIIK